MVYHNGALYTWIISNYCKIHIWSQTPNHLQVSTLRQPAPPPKKKPHLKIDLDHGDKNKWWFNQNKIGGQLQCCVHASVGELSELARLGMHSHMTVKQCIIQLNLKDHASHPSQSLIVRNPTGTYPDHMHRKVELSFISFQSLPFFDFAVVFW